ncbi:hypothetical protein BZA05DRAFT_196340 [Tricharina praecox]|uniref:uncharacterized protein n=1 Tax=Tricharina praecox TaxID=43433 RepID=UPI0022210944|nr:uncharacterized protein BZA05DRAFT_196340 [Tricharina praecox]KAI5856242.1 hypothetical protein BZA05DRAFT_196340 [Tricharina praecox]
MAHDGHNRMDRPEISRSLPEAPATRELIAARVEISRSPSAGLKLHLSPVVRRLLVSVECLGAGEHSCSSKAQHSSAQPVSYLSTWSTSTWSGPPPTNRPISRLAVTIDSTLLYPTIDFTSHPTQCLMHTSPFTADPIPRPSPTSPFTADLIPRPSPTSPFTADPIPRSSPTSPPFPAPAPNSSPARFPCQPALPLDRAVTHAGRSESRCNVCRM